MELIKMTVRMSPGRTRTQPIKASEILQVISSLHWRLPVQQRDPKDEKQKIMEWMVNRGIFGRSSFSEREMIATRGELGYKEMIFTKEQAKKLDQFLTDHHFPSYAGGLLQQHHLQH